jgi:hypothetical protein
MRTDIDVVHVIFKTHLDIGFTDYARNVIDRYMTGFIPDALTLAHTMRTQHPDEPFSWTVGSWLVYEYLERATPAQRQQMEAAIQDGLVVWHGVPFTTHTELMDERLFRFSLSLSAELDKRFGKKTISAKMTDVPGHTHAMIPLLAEYGIRFFHVGVNAAATVPDVPPVFFWRDAATDTSLLMMYHKVYGDIMVLPGTSEAVAIIFTGDNMGPPSVASVHETYAELRKQFPNATFIGSTLDAVATTILNVNSELPIIMSEIGDTWIQGVGTDPTKVSQYRELLRLRDEWIAADKIEAVHLNSFQRALLMIPEHTWGMDLKTHLAEYVHYETDALAQVRSTPKFSNFEASWTEQREYITATLDTLSETSLKAEAENRLQAIKPQKPDLSHYQVSDDNHFESEHWSLTINKSNGAIISLVHKISGHTLADETHPLSLFIYETFSTVDYERYWQQYIRNKDDEEIRLWAYPDNAKPQLQVAEHGTWHPTVKNIYQRSDVTGLHILVEATLLEASQKIGAPKTLFLTYTLWHSGLLEITLSWFDKPACRLPEAFWLTFCPVDSAAGTWSMHKLGSEINPMDVISNGARTLHATDTGVTHYAPNYRLKIHSLDVPLVAPGKPSLLNFHNQLPDMAGGMHFNLYNNIWGTNFPMWFDDDAAFRFTINIL